MILPKLKLLLADDHQLFISGLEHILKDQMNISVCDFALNGKEAIDKARQVSYDVILMDINMPMIDGIEATKEIKKFDPHVRILIVSMLSDFDTISKALKAGAAGFLMKNSDASEFVKAFKTIERDEIYLSSHLSEFIKRDNADKVIGLKSYVKFVENIVTPREKAILKMIVEGHTNAVIAETLNLSAKTVDTHRNNMLAKLQLPNTAALVSFAIHNKLV